MKKIVFLLSSIIILGWLSQYDKSNKNIVDNNDNDDGVFVKQENQQYSSQNEFNFTLPSLRVYNSINKYSEKYDIPKDIAFAVSYIETGYKGPLHFNYNPALSSSVGAVGPMQIMPETGKRLCKLKGMEYSHDKLMNDIEYNVELSMVLLRRLYDKYGDWQVALGYYNTGQPIVNGYALQTSKGYYTWKTTI